MLDTPDLTNYRHQIRQEYLRRTDKNKSYSLRAFARDLSIDPGQLSLVLKGTKNLSLSKASDVSQKLFKYPRDMLLFYHAVEWEIAPNEVLKNQIFTRLQKLTEAPAEREANISDDEFDTIANWHNLPMLELGSLPEFELTPESGAEYFGIPVLDSRLGLQTMARLGFLKRVGGVYKKIKSVVTTTEVPSLAIKRFHQQMIAKAGHALFHQDFKKRYYSAATFKLSPARMGEIKKMIDEHEKKVLEYALTYQNEKDQVIYQLNHQLFSLKDQDYE